MKWKCAFALLLLLAVTAGAQQRGKPTPDRWGEMVLERTTPREAIARFGKPTGDSAVAAPASDPIWRWVKGKKGEVFRYLSFKRPEPDVEMLWLLFRNGKLVEILIKVPDFTLSPNVLPSLFGGGDFQPLRDSRGEVRTPQDFERRANMIPTKDVPGVYHVAAVTKKSFIVALVGGTRDHAADLAERARARDTPGFFPGRVSLIHLWSRKLENKEPTAAADAGRAGAAAGAAVVPPKPYRRFKPPSPGADNSVLRAAVQPDGKVVIAGIFFAYNGDEAAPDKVMRLNADGSLDKTFNYGGAGVNGVVRALALQPDGKLVVGGDFTSYNGDEAAPDRVLRLNADGTLDKTFNAGGAGAVNPSENGYLDTSVTALALQPDGRIIVGGSSMKYNGDRRALSNLMRLNADGTRDTSFNPRGWGLSGVVLALALQRDGKVVVGGNFTAYNYDSDSAALRGVIRVNADGSLDKTFNAGGAGAEGVVSALSLRPDGKVFIGGNFFAYNGEKAGPCDVLRLNADGTRDKTFNAGTAAADNIVFDNLVLVLASQPDGKVIVGGAFYKHNGDAAAPHFVLRLNADGTLDKTFNAGGWGATGYVYALALQRDGKAIVGGDFDSYNRDGASPRKVMRLNADGTPDTSFNPLIATRRP